MGDIVKKPQQARSQETRNRIIEAGSRLLNERGYYNVTTADIAKEAGVSTGILYRYFKNKLDITIEVLKKISQERITPLIGKLGPGVLNRETFVAFLDYVMEEMCDFHTELGAMHNDLITLFSRKAGITHYFEQLEDDILKQIEAVLILNHVEIEHISEKVHIVYNLLENYCHEKVLHLHDYLDYDVLKQEVINSLVHIVFG